jgi:hypothetical protein
MMIRNRQLFVLSLSFVRGICCVGVDVYLIAVAIDLLGFDMVLL